MADRWMLGETAALDDYISTPPSNILGNMAQGVTDLLNAPGNTMAANPYSPASEEHQFFEDQRRSNTYRTGPDAAMNIVGMGTPFAVKGGLGMAGGRMKQPDLAPGALAATSEYHPPFYSAVERAMQGAKQNAAPGQQWAGFLRNQPGVKQEEVEALGLSKLFEQPGAVPKQAVLGEIAANRVNVGEVVKFEQSQKAPATRVNEIDQQLHSIQNEFDRLHQFDNAAASERRATLAAQERELQTERAGIVANWQDQSSGRTKFQQYTLPGGENYREMLLTLPEQKGSGFDPAKVELRRKQQSTTQGSTIVSYDGKNIGTFDDPPTLNTQTGQYHQRPDQYWIDIMRRRYGGDPQMGIKPLDQGVNFRSSHFDEPNVLAHVRYNDRVIDGKKTLFVEEVQSDWHQMGKKRGYQGEGLDYSLVDKGREGGGWRVMDSNGVEVGGSQDQRTAEAILRDYQSGRHGRRADNRVPDAPFKTTWPELAMKRIIREAAEKGYDKVAWTPGEVQAARYDLSKHVKEIEYIKRGDNAYELGIADINGRDVPLPTKFMTLQDIEGTVGKEIAEKISKGEGTKFRGHDGYTLSGLDLQVGGEGMKGFYDEILPATVNRLVKKHGGRVQQTDMTAEVQKPTAYRDYQEYADMRRKEKEGKLPKHSVHTIDITPSLRAAAMKGFPLFTAGGVAATGIMGEMARQDEYR